MNFSELGLSDGVLKAVAESGYTTPTPIQEQAIPYVLMGRDVLGCAETGTGKTAVFALPMIDILSAGRAKARMPRGLVLEPTRELAAQVAESFEVYGKHHRLSVALLIGGESLADQVKAIDRGPDVLIATPGRLLDLFERGRLLLNDVKILVIDEADRMLDMGFIPDVERIVGLLPKIRTTLLFSATLLPEIRRLADAFLINPKQISVAPPATAAATIVQGLVMVRPPHRARHAEVTERKRAELRRLIDAEDVKNALVFCNRKRDVGVLYRSLARHGYGAGQLHGDMPQAARTETLDKFRRGEIRLLVCSDVAARGLDIEGMSHVINFDVPAYPESYVHRIGRTGRAGRSGRALTIATPEDIRHVRDIERLIGSRIPAHGDGHVAAPTPVVAPVREERHGRPRRDHGHQRPPRAPSPRPRDAAAAPPHRPKHEPRPSGVQVKGLGEHVPAFLRGAPGRSGRE
jgi:superfamily II DNA/RNA helicase